MSETRVGKFNLMKQTTKTITDVDGNSGSDDSEAMSTGPPAPIKVSMMVAIV